MRLVAVLALLAGDVVQQEPAPLVELARRASTDVVLTFRVADGHHVQANPAANEFLIPASLELRDACGVKSGPPVYPPPVALRLEGTDRDLAVWDHSFQIVVPLRAGRFARRGDCVLRGTFVFQACDERTCLAPMSIGVALPVRIH